ncbi:MAG: hypothetical protein EXX96DRAFT_653894 [Benjaminiella poitrasii]|nr:MAG: hypothetical protein EXX96DRAFT_653894 [Benjaminiella poitrasii]
MFFEATYVPSPPLSVVSIDDNDILSISDEPTTDMNDSKSQHKQQSIAVDFDTDSNAVSDKPVDHVIFVIHGIGQQTEQYGHFYEHIENLQETTRQVLQAKIPDHNVRIELIPIEWHRHIHDQVDPLLNKITLKSIPTIRLIENDYLADVLFYFSKERGQTIIDNVTQLFNTSYHNFMSKHPDFNGKIIILGYSLGGIIVWDILSHQRELQTDIERDMSSKLNTIQFSKLDFKPHYFFGLGSPISAVLVFRGQDPKYYHPEHDIQFENIFHPFDPLGYRLEPLFNDYFIDKPAVLVERSVPIGPSFSFPSMPSFPSSGFFSFFSWKQTGDKAAKTIYNATSETTEDNKQKKYNNKQKTSAGLMTSLFQYFSKGGGGRYHQQEDLTTRNDISNTNDADTAAKEDDESILVAAAAAAAAATTCWDPIQTRKQLLALRDDLDKTLKTLSPDTKKRRPWATRSKSIHVCEDSSGSSIYSSSLDHNSDGSVKMDNFMSSQHTKLRPQRLKLRKTKTTEPRASAKCHHLVEVLGIDGALVDERSRMMPKIRRFSDQDETREPMQQQSSDEETNLSSSNNNRDEQEDYETSETKPTYIDNKSSSNDIWSDLNSELNKPGPAITNPGESKADVAQNATITQTNTHAKQKDKQTDVEEEMEVNKLLPSKRRLDYVLQPESVMSMIANEYLIGLRAHFSYWTNKDFIWHMLCRVEDLEGKKKKTKDGEEDDDDEEEQNNVSESYVTADTAEDKSSTKRSSGSHMSLHHHDTTS